MRRKKIELLHKRETTATGKSFMENQTKSRKYFLHTSNKTSENFNIKHLQQSKTDLSKETKKKLLRKDTLRVSEAVIQRSCVKKVSLKILRPVYLHIIEIDNRYIVDKNLLKPWYQKKQSFHQYHEVGWVCSYTKFYLQM